jgi:elongator complex protein 4
MSSFKRKSASASVASFPAGVRSTTHCQSVYTLSSGVASLDDVLGGGIPLGSVLIALAPDVHSAWGTLLLKYFIAQGLALEQFVKVISDASTSLVESCMWLPDSKNHNEESTTIHDDDNEEAPAADETISIAWRYEKMQPFQTTVVSNATACMHFFSHRGPLGR